MDTNVHSMDQAIKKLSDQEIDQFFELLKNNADLFDKIFPPLPIVKLLKRGEHEMAYKLLKDFHKS